MAQVKKNCNMDGNNSLNSVGLYARKLEIDVGGTVSYEMETGPPGMENYEQKSCADEMVWGEDKIIATIVPNILKKIIAVEEVTLFGVRKADRMYKLTKNMFNAFAENVDLSALRSLKVCFCTLDVNMEEMNNFVKDTNLVEFIYGQTTTVNNSFTCTPVAFLSDNFLRNISKCVMIRSDCDSFCWSVTDITIERWKIMLPTTIELQNCHTSFTLKAIWELVQIAKKGKFSFYWEFGYIEASLEHEKTLVQIQKCDGFFWTTERRNNKVYFNTESDAENERLFRCIQFKMI